MTEEHNTSTKIFSEKYSPPPEFQAKDHEMVDGKMKGGSGFTTLMTVLVALTIVFDGCSQSFGIVEGIRHGPCFLSESNQDMYVVHYKDGSKKDLSVKHIYRIESFDQWQGRILSDPPDRYLETSYYDFVVKDSADQGTAEVQGALPHIIRSVKENNPDIKFLYLNSDNASGFASNNNIEFIYQMNKINWGMNLEDGDCIFVVRYLNTEAGKGSDPLDTHFAYLAKAIKEFASRMGNKICTPKQLFDALCTRQIAGATILYGKVLPAPTTIDCKFMSDKMKVRERHDVAFDVEGSNVTLYKQSGVKRTSVVMNMEGNVGKTSRSKPISQLREKVPFNSPTNATTSSVNLPEIKAPKKLKRKRSKTPRDASSKLSTAELTSNTLVQFATTETIAAQQILSAPTNDPEIKAMLDFLMKRDPGRLFIESQIKKGHAMKVIDPPLKVSSEIYNSLEEKYNSATKINPDMAEEQLHASDALVNDAEKRYIFGSININKVYQTIGRRKKAKGKKNENGQPVDVLIADDNDDVLGPDDLAATMTNNRRNELVLFLENDTANDD